MSGGSDSGVVEIVRRSYEAWNEGREEAGRPMWSEDCEWHDPPDFPDPAISRGRDAVARHLNELWGDPGVAEVSNFTFDDLIAVVEDEVLVLISFQARFASSGLPMDLSLGQLVQVRDGKVSRWRAFSSQEAARAAAGLGS